MHESGRMLLALYANGLIRLWNMLDARCLFKFKAGLSANEDSDVDAEENREEGEGVDEEKADMEAQKTLKSEQVRKVLKEFDKMNMRPEKVMWEPTRGK